MRRLLNLALCITILFLSSCSKDGIDEQIENQSEQTEGQRDYQISSEVIEKLKSLELNPEGVYKKDFTLPDGSVETNYVIEGDITITHDKLFSLNTPQPHEKKGMIQNRYRTNNLVNYNTPLNTRAIRVKGITTGSGALTPKMRTALEEAINRYETKISTGLFFSLNFGSSSSSDDIIVQVVSNNAIGGSAGFPSGGNPYRHVRINSGSSDLSVTLLRHIIMHEIGHCIGLRHTDWETRQSCGSGSDGETASPEGAIHIPGTPKYPTGPGAKSLMLACLNSGSIGEFENYDKIALEYIYPSQIIGRN
ncbi:M57 family metalloprotease [Sinomicrobium sp. M5D2P9]